MPSEVQTKGSQLTLNLTPSLCREMLPRIDTTQDRELVKVLMIVLTDSLAKKKKVCLPTLLY